MDIALIAVGCVLLLLSLVIVAAYVCYRMAFYQNPVKNIPDPFRHIKNDGSEFSNFSRSLVENILKEPYEEVFVTAYDGTELCGRLYFRDESRPFAIQAHGYRSTPMIDFSGGGALALELGFNVIMIDQRAHGKSAGRTITFGVKESLDIFSWIKFVSNRWGEDREIILQGISMGAATVIMAAAYPLPKSVKGIMADCPYSDGESIVKKVILGMKLPPRLTYPIVRLGGRIFGRFDIGNADCVTAAKKSRVPILLIHGEADAFVPCDMSRKIAEDAPMVELHTFPDAHHGTSFIIDAKKYKMLVSKFCSDVLDDEKYK